MSDKWIRASEINAYVYCRRAWWLQRVGGREAANVQELQSGTAYHEGHGRLVQRSTWVQRLAYALIFVTVGFVVFSFLMAMGV